ncbi:MAG: HEAT repeat domain-containing protein [bacterium]
MVDLDNIVALLDDPATERRVAAAIVLGALKPKSAAVVEGLLGLLETGEPALIRHGLDALAALGARKAAPAIVGFLSSRDVEIRDAAERALVAIGESVVPLIRERMEKAAPEEQRALNHVLAELGGAEAFSTLLSGILASEGDPQAALAARQQVRSADASLRKKYLAQTERFLAEQRKGGEHPGAVAAAIKVLGFLEDPKAVPTLLAHAQAADQPPAVRKEAIIALRFALQNGRSPSAEVVNALVGAALAEDRSLAQTALLTLGGLDLDAQQSQRIQKLAEHPDFERARLAIEHLGRQRDTHAARVLANVVEHADRRRAELAVQTLASKAEGAEPLAKALIATADAERARFIAKALAPHLRTLAPALKKQLRAQGLARLGAGEGGAEALLDAARMADPGAWVDELRALAAKQRKAAKLEEALRTLGVLCRSDQATDEDRYHRAALELKRARHDRATGARAHDPSLSTLGQLLTRGFDVGAALRKDKSIGLEELYYVGFHFAERGQPLGIELLEAVVAKAGRAKLGKMAKNKLALIAD